jgi:hypothetical protein
MAGVVVGGNGSSNTAPNTPTGEVIPRDQRACGEPGEPVLPRHHAIEDWRRRGMANTVAANL